jgi:hypothetical protein
MEVAPKVSEPSAPQGSQPMVVPFSLSFVHNVGTNGFRTDVIVRGFALNFVHGTHQRLDGAALGLLGNFLTEELNGVQVTPGMNLVWGNARGLQIGVLPNIVRDTLSGAQVAVAGNVAGDLARWAQVAVLGNYAGSLQGVQLGVGGNYAHAGVWGAQLAVGANVSMGDVNGLQVGLVSNIAPAFAGLQWGLLSNLTAEGQGAQLAFINVAKKMTGLQVGLINVAAEVDGDSLGLINVIGNGYHSAEIFADDTAPTVIGIKSGSRHLYSLATLGLDPFQESPTLHAGIGVGWHQQFFEKFSLDVDLQGLTPKFLPDFSNFVRREGGGLEARLRLLPRWDLMEHLSLFAGPVASLSFSFGSPDVESASYVPGLWTLAENDVFGLNFRPGFVAGISAPF